MYFSSCHLLTTVAVFSSVNVLLHMCIMIMRISITGGGLMNATSFWVYKSTSRTCGVFLGWEKPQEDDERPLHSSRITVVCLIIITWYHQAVFYRGRWSCVNRTSDVYREQVIDRFPCNISQPRWLSGLRRSRVHSLWLLVDHCVLRN